jgi:hypothetical protein
MVFELVKKHTGQMNIGVTTSRGNIWHDILNQEWLIVLVSVRAISEMKSNIIRVLLTVTRNSDDNGAWYIDWLSLYNHSSISCWLRIIDLLTEADLLVAHIWMTQRFTYDANSVCFVHWTVWWRYLLDIWVIVVQESNVWNWECLTISWYWEVVEVITRITISEI